MKTFSLIAFLSISSLFFLNPLLGQSDSKLDLAIAHVEQNLNDLNITEAELRNLELRDEYTSEHNGVTHLYLNQLHNGVQVENAILNVNILPDGSLLNIGNRLIRDLADRINQNSAKINHEEALNAAFKHLKIEDIGTPRVVEHPDANEFIFDHAGIALEPIKVKQIYQVLQSGKEVRLAWSVEIYELSAQNWWKINIDAVNSEVLSVRNQVIQCNFDHSENVECHDEHTHSVAGFDQNLLMGGTYNVLPMPIESPNHGEHSLVVNPEDPFSSPFGWHDTDGEEGAEFTITRGNNVHAYQDIFSQNASLGDEPDGGSELIFDFEFSPLNTTPYTQVDAAVVNLFYWSNVMHDLWYNYGFTEIAGNFQVNNYDNGGMQGDYVRAEALDGTATNNANFGTGADGSGARMQMFIWTNEGLPSSERFLDITAPENIAGQYRVAPAAFGADFPEEALVSEVILGDDGVPNNANLCEVAINAEEINGKIALIDRGDCQFGTKSLRAQEAGAIAVVICNNAPGDIFPPGPGADGGAVNIPVMMVSQADCEVFKANLTGLTMSIEEMELVIPNPGPNGRDGDFDNGIIAHEYGHGISIRLAGGPSTGGCLTNFEQQGEGWSDWFGLVMQTTKDNFAEEPRGIGTYALGQPITGGGIRPFPYTRDMNINPMTYNTINSVSVPHGVGSVWCTMIWDLYWNLIDVYGFDEDFYNGTGGNNIAMQLVIDGLKLQACNPTFLDARDGIIAADIANNGGENVCLIWETFARRGLGANAQAGGVDSFVLPDACNRSLKISKESEVEEEFGMVNITYNLQVINDYPEPLNNVAISDRLPIGTSLIEESIDCDEFTVNGDILEIVIGDLAVNDTFNCSYKLSVPPALFSLALFDDGVENGTANWSSTSPGSDQFWGINEASYEGEFAWFAENVDVSTDQLLTITLPFNLSGDEPIFSFWHRYNTEASWDGGVIEISLDGGFEWEDLGDHIIQNGYDGNLQDNPASALSGRPAFHGSSDEYIQTLVDLSAYSGQEVFIRFRFATDGAVASEGWYIDNVFLYGNFHEIRNEACVSSDLNENVCSSVLNIINTDMVNSTTDLLDEAAVLVYPNPATDIVEVRMSNDLSGLGRISIHSADGRLVHSEEAFISGAPETINISALSSGLYIIKVEVEQGMITKKLIVD